MDIYLQKEIEKVPIINENRNYWFIRSYGGEVYNDFKNRNYVGIGLNEVPFEYITSCVKSNNTNNFKRLKDFIEVNTKYKNGQATNWANQLIAFNHIAKVGDIVIVPNKNSSRFSIGRIDSDVFLVNENNTFYHNNKYEKFPEKRRNVTWHKEINKKEADNDLRGITYTQRAISNANNFSNNIEGLLSNIYIKEDKVYLTISIEQDEDINAFELNDFLTSITYFYNEFCLEEGIELDRELFIKIKLQSRGKLALQATKIIGIVGLAGLLLLSNNNEFKASIGNNNVTFTTGDGLLESVSNFMDRKQERKIKYQVFLDSIENLKVKRDRELITNNQVSNDTIEPREGINGENNSNENQNPN